MSSPAPLRYRVTTLGCRVNHAETREIETLLRSRGLRRATADERAQLEIVHTCSVTTAAAAKSRQAIRRSARRADRTSGQTPAAVFVTGCYASSDPEPVATIVGRPERVIGHRGPSNNERTALERLADRIDRWLADAVGDSKHGAATASSPPASSRAEGDSAIIPLPVVIPDAAARHRRAELKIQDGCDAHCTFCIIPRTRPTLRSKRIGDAVDEARRLVELGHLEIVLSGIFIGAYGHETALRRRQRHADARPLADLLDAVARVPGLQRVRISSMEPGDVSDELLDAMVANRPVVVPHLHLPLQSGSDAVLRRMNRQYRIGAYLDMIDRVETALREPGGLRPAITTDVICGFPGETLEDFGRTVDVARRVGYLHMHVFPYSPRAGTAAARWRDRRIPATEIRRRVQRLIDLESDPVDGLSLRYRRHLVGKTARVILEGRSADEPGVMAGRCDRYALVHVRTEQPRGALLQVRITGATADRTVGEALAPDRRRPLPVLGAAATGAG